MTKVSIREGNLTIDVLGWHKIWAFKSRIEVPVDHISGVRLAAKERVGGIRFLGTYLPCVITAGTFHTQGKKVFWDVHDYSKAIAIDLRNDAFSTFIIEVADPVIVIEQINCALTAKITLTE